MTGHLAGSALASTSTSASGFPTSRSVTIAGFILIAAALLALHLYARRPHTRVPSFAQLCGYLMRERWGRVGMLLAWWWLGWHFLART